MYTTTYSDMEENWWVPLDSPLPSDHLTNLSLCNDMKDPHALRSAMKEVTRSIEQLRVAMEEMCSASIAESIYIESLQQQISGHLDNSSFVEKKRKMPKPSALEIPSSKPSAVEIPSSPCLCGGEVCDVYRARDESSSAESEDKGELVEYKVYKKTKSKPTKIIEKAHRKRTKAADPDAPPKPKKPRTEAQKAAFEKAVQTRKAKIAERKLAKEHFAVSAAVAPVGNA